MKILRAKIYNFASYKELIFEFTNQRLTLISGPTGSGKSTLCDIIPWVLFGRTAKNGAVDEIRSWGEADATDGTLEFQHGSHYYYVRRIRGEKVNDLYYGFLTDYGAKGTRGKDLNDTQKQINQLIGIDVETYLMGSYYHEFSQVASFFATTAKVRRGITEQLADLILAKNLQEKSSAYNKEIKKELLDLKQEIALQNNTLQHLQKQYETEENRLEEWYSKQRQQLEELESNAKNYDRKKLQVLEELFYESSLHEQEQTRLKEITQSDIQACTTKLKTDAYYLEAKADLMLKMIALKHDKCSECGAAKNTDQVMLLDKRVYQLTRDEEENIKTRRRLIDLGIVLNKTAKPSNPYTKLIQQEKERKNTYLEQIEELKKKENPYVKSQESASEVIKAQQLNTKSTELLINELSVEQADIELLNTTLDAFRGAIIARTIDYLQDSTNKLLNNHFDAEIRVLFSVVDADKLDVGITKDGHTCTYTQLSKGQRQLLKLCFGVSVMKAVSNHNGVNFNCLWFDESVEGMDDSMRIKSFGLLEALAIDYDSIFVVDHSEAFKSQFNNRYDISMINGNSIVEYE